MCVSPSLESPSEAPGGVVKDLGEWSRAWGVVKGLGEWSGTENTCLDWRLEQEDCKLLQSPLE